MIIMEIKTAKRNNYLEVTVSGLYDLNDAVDQFSYVLEECRRLELNKLLIDFRKLDGTESATLKSFYTFGTAEQYYKYLASGGQKLQFVYLAPVLTTFEPGMEIADQKKLPAKLFDNLNEALKWLNVK